MSSGNLSRRATGSGGRLLVVTVLLVGALLATPAALLAHARLTKSAPASTARVASSPTAVTLWFSEAPELALTRITLLGPNFMQVALGEVQRLPGEPFAVTATIRSTLRAGEYTVIWQTAAVDGHPSRGRFSFVIVPSSGATAPSESSLAGPSPRVEVKPRHAERQLQPISGTEDQSLGAESPAYVGVRWLSFIALLALIGVTAFRWLVLPRAARLAARHARGPALRSVLNPLVRRAARIGAIAAGALLAAAAARLYLQAVAMHGGGGTLHVAMMRQLVAQTRWGRVWLVQVVATVVALLALVAALRTATDARSGAHTPRVVGAVAVLVLAFTPALGGHAAAAPRLTTLAVALDGLHVLGAGGWLGALLVLLTVGLPVALAAESPDRGGLVADLVNAFSPTALVFATLVVLTGLFAAWLHLGSLAALWSSSYGRTLLLKLGVLTPAVGTGAHIWRRVRPALGDVPAARRLHRSAAVELAVGVVVILVTAVLVALQTPS